MELIKRDESGAMGTFVETTALTEEERNELYYDLEEYIVEMKSREAAAVNDAGLEVQVQYLIDTLGEDAAIDLVLRFIDAAHTWRFLK